MSAFVWAVLTAVVWGCVPVIEKTGLLKLDPVAGLFYRSLGVIIGIVILVSFKWAAIRSSFGGAAHGWLFLVLGGFLASFVGQMFFYNALKRGEASTVVPIAAAYPLLSFVLGVIFLGESFTIAKAGGVACVLAGIFLLK